MRSALLCRRFPRSQRVAHRYRSGQEVAHQSFVHVEYALVLRLVPQTVALGQYPPGGRRQLQRVRQALKNHVAILGAVSGHPERGKRESVRSVVCQIEAALERQALLCRVRKTCLAGPPQTGNLSGRRRLGLELPGAYQIQQLGRGHAPIRARTYVDPRPPGRRTTPSPAVWPAIP